MNGYFFIILMFIAGGCLIYPRPVPLSPSQTAEYYRDFNWMRLTPEQKLAGKPKYSHIRVIKENGKADSIEMFLADEPLPSQTIKKLGGNDSVIVYTGTSLHDECFSIDTFIITGNKLFEFRNCYSSGGPYVNKQIVMVYEQLHPDTLKVEYFKLHGLYRDRDKRLPADTSLERIIAGVNRWDFSEKESFYIVHKDFRVLVKCRTQNNIWCIKEPYEGRNYYGWGSLYWTLMTKDPLWRLGGKTL